MVFKIFTRAIILDENDRVLLLKKNSKQKYWAWELMLPGWTLEFWKYGTWKTRILLIFRLQRNWIIW